MVSDSKAKEIFALDLDNKPNSDCHDNFMLSKSTNRHPYKSALTIFLSSLMKLLCFPPKLFSSLTQSKIKTFPYQVTTPIEIEGKFAL